MTFDSFILAICAGSNLSVLAVLASPEVGGGGRVQRACVEPQKTVTGNVWMMHCELKIFGLKEIFRIIVVPTNCLTIWVFLKIRRNCTKSWGLLLTFMEPTAFQCSGRTCFISLKQL